MTTAVRVLVLGLVAVPVSAGCSRHVSAPGTSGPKGSTSSAEPPLAEVGKTPEGTLHAYYHYKDRGEFTKLRSVVSEHSISMVPAQDGRGMSSRAQRLRGIAADHVEEAGDEAMVYYRTWFSRATKAKGGRPAIARLLKEDGAWKLDVKATLDLTVANRKGKDQFGFYDGTENWWK